jgi:hypothetical protein
MGSIYESLLELHPELNADAYTFILKTYAGSERKTTGSHYTHRSLIRCLLDSALEPLLIEAMKKPEPEKALLALKVADLACGSGHFLIAASHRIAKYLAIVRTGEGEPPVNVLREALRDVVANCIYGVDINPLAVELCKVSLWLESLDPRKPLGFLDHRIKCGNSIIGATPELLAKGIPDDAFKPIEGDDPVVATSIRRKNRGERQGQADLFTISEDRSDWREAAAAYATWTSLPEDNIEQVAEKARQYETLVDSSVIRYQHELADLWTAAFFWPLTTETYDTVPTQDKFRHLRDGAYTLDRKTAEQVKVLAKEHRFFHWHLEFPEVFMKRQGFDCNLGNPPWEQINLMEKEFFAQRDPEIADAPDGADRKRLIAQLPVTNPSLWNEFILAKRVAEGESKFLRTSERYPLNAVGRINTYQIFAGLFRDLLSNKGRAGLIVPTGIATDDTNKQFFADLTEKKALVSLYDFENREGIFPAVHRSYKFCLLTMGGPDTAPEGTDFAFFLTNAAQLHESDRHFKLSSEDIVLLNPNTRTCPIFRGKRDAEITKAIYRRVPVLINESKGEAGNPWEITFKQGLFNMTSDSHLFRTLEQLAADGWQLNRNIFTRDGELYLPLYEAKMIHQFDHRWATYEKNGDASQNVTDNEKHDHAYEPLPRYWVEKGLVQEQLAGNWDKNWFLTFRDIARSTDERTSIFSIIPFSAVGNNLPLLFAAWASMVNVCIFLGLATSLAADFVARQKLGGIHMNFYLLKQLPFRIDVDSLHIKQQVTKSVLELTYTSYDMKSFAEDVWAELHPNTATRPPLPEPFIWDEERRFKIRCELDALYLHLYGINRADADYILETFPIVKRKDIAQFGEYRTKNLILEIYDGLALTKAANIAALGAEQKEKTDLQPEEIPLKKFVAMAYPATDTDKSICAAALAIVEQSPGISSMDQLDALLLVTHPDWCKVFLDQNEHRPFEVVRKSAPKDLFVGENQSINWKESRDYIELRNAISVNHGDKGQAISLAVAWANVKNGLPGNADALVGYALKAMNRVSELRRDLTAIPRDQLRIIQVFEEQHRIYRLAA